MHDYTLYSHPASMYSGKVRSYMNYKRLNYVDKLANVFEVAVVLKRRTGEAVVPVVKTSRGEWLQDTALIIEELERRHPEPSILAPTPIQSMVAAILECWADEWWLPVTMHYRWFYPENHEFIRGEFARTAGPFEKTFVGRFVAAKVMQRLDGAAKWIGFGAAQRDVLERWTEATLDLLETHFAQHDYMLGGRPTIADYALLSSFFGHLNRDPAPKRILMTSRPHLAAWSDRTHRGDPATGDLLADDAIPATIMPIIRLFFREILPMAAAYREVIKAHIQEQGLTAGADLKRFLARAEYPMGDGVFARAAAPFMLWKIQRLRARFDVLEPAEQAIVDGWLEQSFGERITSFDFGPPLQRKGLSATLA